MADEAGADTIVEDPATEAAPEEAPEPAGPRPKFTLYGECCCWREAQSQPVRQGEECAL